MGRRTGEPQGRSHASRRLVRFGLWLLALVALGIGLAQAATYAYDANGRLRAITNSTGASAVYVYDVMGNLLHVDSVPAGQLKIFALLQHTVRSEHRSRFQGKASAQPWPMTS